MPFISRLQSLEQYSDVKYEVQKNEDAMTQLKKMALQILTMRFFIRKEQNTHHEDAPIIIKNLQLSVRKGELIGICGQVGHGKTSLFNALLGELRCVTNR